jgi:hypothetical protein
MARAIDALDSEVRCGERAPAPRNPHPLVARCAVTAAAVAVSALLPAAALAQREGFLLGPGSRSGPGSRVVPTNCVTEPDGTVTCDTSVERSPSDTPARVEFDPFSN